jgi:hypothetical protein
MAAANVYLTAAWFSEKFVDEITAGTGKETRRHGA